MVESRLTSKQIATELDHWCGLLQTLADTTFDAEVEVEAHVAVHDLIAAGVAVLAGEEAPEPCSAVPARSTLARDLWITADLVRRSLRAGLTEP